MVNVCHGIRIYAYLLGNFVVRIFGVVATKLCSSKCKYSLEFSISNECSSEWCILFKCMSLCQPRNDDDGDNDGDGGNGEGDNAIMPSLLRLFFSKWLRWLLFSLSLALFLLNISLELCRFGDAFNGNRWCCCCCSCGCFFGADTLAAASIASIVPKNTNSAIVTLVAHK